MVLNLFYLIEVIKQYNINLLIVIIVNISKIPLILTVVSFSFEENILL